VCACWKWCAQIEIVVRSLQLEIAVWNWIVPFLI
jgi:hypothetical protein